MIDACPAPAVQDIIASTKLLLMAKTSYTPLANNIEAVIISPKL